MFFIVLLYNLKVNFQTKMQYYLQYNLLKENTAHLVLVLVFTKELYWCAKKVH